VAFIPWEKLPSSLDNVAEGSAVDEDSLPPDFARGNTSAFDSKLSYFLPVLLLSLTGNRCAICNSLAAICNANFDWGFRSPIRSSKSSLLVEDQECYLGPHKFPCQMASHSVQRF